MLWAPARTKVPVQAPSELALLAKEFVDPRHLATFRCCREEMRYYTDAGSSLAGASLLHHHGWPRPP